MRFLSSEKLSAHKYKTPEGYLICTDAILARTGKQTYRKNEVFADTDDDSEIEVDRRPEDVFSDETMASFENKPITVEHPNRDVNAENHNELSVGFARDIRRATIDGQDVMIGNLVITDAQTIEEIENGEHCELSCGYDCDIEDENNPVQKNIRGNHIALCERGRAGIARIVDSETVNDNFYAGIDEVKLRHSNDFKLKELFDRLDKVKAMTTSIDKENEIADIKTAIENRVKQLKNVPNDIYDSTAPADLERIPLEARKEMKEARDKKATLIGIAGQMQDIINRADKIEKDDLRAKAKKILSDLKAQFDIKEADFITVDSVKDEDIFKVDVSSAEDRDVSKFINEAQNVGFTTEDKGYTIYLKNGNKEMLNKLKSRTYTTAIKFVDSMTKDATRAKCENVLASRGFIPYKDKGNNVEVWKYREKNENDFDKQVEEIRHAFPHLVESSYEENGNFFIQVDYKWAINDSFNDAISYLTSYKGSDIWEDEDTKELYLALTKSGKKLSRLNTKDLNKAKQIIEERLSFLEDDTNIQRYSQLSKSLKEHANDSTKDSLSDEQQRKLEKILRHLDKYTLFEICYGPYRGIGGIGASKAELLEDAMYKLAELDVNKVNEILRKNRVSQTLDSLKKFEIHNGNNITIVRAKDLADAIKKVRK